MTRAVYDAWHDAGPVERFHRRAQDRLRATWPTLANALDAMPRAAGGQAKPSGAQRCEACWCDLKDGVCWWCDPPAPVGGQAEPSDEQERIDAQSWAPEGEPTEAAARTLYRQRLRHWEHDWDETSEAQRTVYRGMAGDILRAAAAVSGEQP